MLYVVITYIFYPVLRIFLLFKGRRKPERILVIQRAQIGDLIYSSGVFREIKKHLPGVRLSVVANPITKGLLENSPYVDEAVYLEERYFKGLKGRIAFTRLLRRGRYDAVVALNPSIKFALAPLWALVPIRIYLLPYYGTISPVSDTYRKRLSRRLSFLPRYYGLDYALASRLATHIIRHEAGRLLIETYLKMLEPLGIKSDDISKDVFVSPGAGDKTDRFLSESMPVPGGRMLVGMTVSSGNKIKELASDKLADVALGMIGKHDAAVVLIGSGGDREKAGEVVSLCGDAKARIIDSTGRFALDELPALIGRLSLFIGVDSGITYMADALNVPIVTVAGPTDMSDQRQTGDDVIILQKELPCAPCSHPFRVPSKCAMGTRECVGSFTAQEILAAADRHLTHDRRGAGK